MHRPQHDGNWTTYYDGREKMDAAAAAALTDAAAAEVNGFPTPETAREWLEAMNYRISACGGGLAEFNARPKGGDGVVMARKAMIAAAYLELSTAVAPSFLNYRPGDSAGYANFDSLMCLAYEGQPGIPQSESLFWSKWRREVLVAIETVKKRYFNANWAWDAHRIVNFAIQK